MRFTVQYIPLNKIRPDFPAKVTQRVKGLRNLMWDCMYMLAVRKNRKDGSYVIISGHDRYEYLRKHTKKKYAPCLIDESKAASASKSFVHRIRHRLLIKHFPHISPGKLAPASRSILRSFLNREPRFVQLTRGQQLKVMLLAVRYKKTTISAMKEMVDQFLSREC